MILGSTITSILIVSIAPTAKSPINQVGAVQVPLLNVTPPNCKPAGKTSVTSKFVTNADPLFLAVTVKITVSPAFGVGLSTTLVNTISASSNTVKDAVKISTVVDGIG